MSVDYQEWEEEASQGTAPEGVYDAQLSLPIPSVAVPEPFTHVRKRDGREEPFAKEKIAQAILKAAANSGGMENALANSLASAVSIYLTKQLGGQKPGVDHVHDAVERVLVHMGHPGVAMTYARYRDRRMRLRRMREGDLRMLLREHPDADTPRTGAGVLYVQTSADSVATWDSARIVDALVRETGLEHDIATLIAEEVERQIQKAEIRTLTTSLVRELVDARLVEHGLEEHRERHRRLGVPMFDCEGIVRGATGETVGGHPLMTDWVLGQSVKKEFALARVYSPDVAEAHLMGELHLEGLGVMDRLYGGRLTLMPLLKHGLMLPGYGLVQRPARHADALLAQWVRHFGAVRCCIAGPVQWEDINWYLAPFVRDMADDVLEDYADSVLAELGYVGVGLGLKVGPLLLGVSWAVPQKLRGANAIGADGRETGETYDSLAHTAQRVARALLAAAETRSGATLLLRLDNAFFKAPGCDSFLEAACNAAAEGAHLHFVMERDEPCAENLLAMHEAVAQRVALNLPRAAYCSAKPKQLFERLDTLVALAARATDEKHRFVESLMDTSGNGPLSGLVLHCEDTPLTNPDTLLGEIAVDGLLECVQALHNATPWQSEDTRELAESVLAHLRARCKAESAKLGVQLRLVANCDPSPGERFALLDSRLFPKTMQSVVKINAATGALHYTPGVQLPPGQCGSPMECARLEGRFHAHLSAHPYCAITPPRENMSPAALADFLRKVWQQTTAKAVVFE